MANGDAGKAAGSAEFPLPPYIQDMFGLYMRLFKAQSDRAQGIIERMAKGEYKADDWVSDTAQFWSRWFFDSLSVWDSFQRSASGDAVPTCVFILDDPAEGGDPKSLPLAVQLQPEDRVSHTPFFQIDGSGQIAASQVIIKPNELMNRLLVGFEDIDAIDPGHYLGWVYAEKRGPKLPIAAIHLVKLKADRPGGRPPRRPRTKKAASRKASRRGRKG